MKYCYQCSFFDAFLYKSYSYEHNTGYCENKNGAGYGSEISAKKPACEVFEPGKNKEKIAYIKEKIEED